MERVPLGAFVVPVRTGGKPQYHPRLMLALLIHCYANGLFSSRRIERATYRDVGVRFVAANLHPDHDTIASVRRTNRAAIEAFFLQVLLLAREIGLPRLGTHEYRQAYNAQAVVYADGTQLVLATDLLATTADAPSLAATVLGMEAKVGLPQTVLADTGYDSRAGVLALQARGIEPLVAIGHTQGQRPYDFRPPPAPRTPRLSPTTADE